MPRAAVIIASVMTNAGRRRTATRKPETTPQAAPMASVRPSATGRGKDCTRIAEQTAPMAAMEPTERSIPRVRITKSIPIAMIPVPDIWRRRFVPFLTDRNASDWNDATAIRIRRITGVPNCQNSAPQLRFRSRTGAACAVMSAAAMAPKPAPRSVSPALVSVMRPSSPSPGCLPSTGAAVSPPKSPAAGVPPEAAPRPSPAPGRRARTTPHVSEEMTSTAFPSDAIRWISE